MTLLLPTRRKLAIARLASRGLLGLRRLAGRPPTARVGRGGVLWDLDLREGIDLAVYLGQYQPIPRAFRQAIEGRDVAVLDVGANVGAFTLPIARMLGQGGRVLAIEPTDYAFAKLTGNLALNPALSGRVAPVQALLVAEESGKAEKPEGLYASWPVDGRRGEHPGHLGARMSVAGAATSTLDALVAAPEALGGLPVAAMKLDVDGHEIEVLRGATRLLAEGRPLILVEIAPYIQDERPGGLQEVLDLIAASGYDLLHPDGETPVAPTDAAVRRIVPEGASLDFLARPKP